MQKTRNCGDSATIFGKQGIANIDTTIGIKIINCGLLT